MVVLVFCGCGSVGITFLNCSVRFFGLENDIEDFDMNSLVNEVI
ncbi:18048_t:CDS:1, partial [Entrophospora sp. SA101]